MTPLHAAVLFQGSATEQITENVDIVRGTLDGMLESFMAMLPLMVAGIVVFLLLLLLASGVRKLVERYVGRSSNRGAALALGRVLYVVMVLLALLIAVTIAFPSMTPARLISMLGIGGIAIGFAFKDIFQNLLAGILLLIRHPFRVGDEIITGQYTGTVESIETRATFIRSYDGMRIIIPNSDVFTKPMAVITAYGMLRSEYDLGIGYGDDLGRAKRIVLEAIRQVEGVLKTPAPDVLVWDLAESSKNIRLRWWTTPLRQDVLRIRDAVLQGVAEAVTAAGMDIPFPTQVVLFHDQTEEVDGDRTRQREGWPAGDAPPPPRRSPRLRLVEEGEGQ